MLNQDQCRRCNAQPKLKESGWGTVGTGKKIIHHPTHYCPVCRKSYWQNNGHVQPDPPGKPTDWGYKSEAWLLEHFDYFWITHRI